MVPDVHRRSTLPMELLLDNAPVQPTRQTTAAPFHALPRPLGRLLGLERLRAIYDDVTFDEAHDPARAILDRLGIAVEAAERDIERIPAGGPLVIVANHPFGGADGLALLALVRTRRPDVRLLANSLLATLSPLRPDIIPVNPFDTATARMENVLPMRSALRWLQQGGALIVFPAGEVSSYSPSRGGVRDRSWNETVARLVRRSAAQVVPVWFAGRNRIRFQIAGLVHPRLRTALLPRELLARRGSKIEARVGRVITKASLSQVGGDAPLAALLRERTYLLADRGVERKEVRHATPVAPEADRDELVREMTILFERSTLAEQGPLAVALAEAAGIPMTLMELGRLREISFRAAGEGSGRDRDLDDADLRYRHLILWNHERREIAGSYRIGFVGELLDRHGAAGLYSSTLFDYHPRFLEWMRSGLELGRSFVRPEYQRSHTPLMLLWKGIGAIVAGSPEHRLLFGPVSISSEYSLASRRLMAAWCGREVDPQLASFVRPRTPFGSAIERGAHGLRVEALAGSLATLEAAVTELEEGERGLPVLLRQYVRLGGRPLGCNVDGLFSNVLDLLMVVDLAATERRLLARYMGSEGADRFLAHHRRDACRRAEA